MAVTNLHQIFLKKKMIPSHTYLAREQSVRWPVKTTKKYSIRREEWENTFKGFAKPVSEGDGGEEPLDREGAALGSQTVAASPRSAAGKTTEAHPCWHSSAVADQETQQTAWAAWGLFLWKVLFLKISSLCILIVDFCCQKTGLVNLSLPPPSQGNWWGERLYFIKPLSKIENIHRFVSPQTECAGINYFGRQTFNDIFHNHIYKNVPWTCTEFARKQPS